MRAPGDEGALIRLEGAYRPLGKSRYIGDFEIQSTSRPNLLLIETFLVQKVGHFVSSALQIGGSAAQSTSRPNLLQHCIYFIRGACMFN